MNKNKYGAGVRYGYLTIITKVPKPLNSKSKRNNFVLCKCDCGNEIVREGSSLPFLKKASCGCKNGHLLKDITGQKFGRLTVLYRTDAKIFSKGAVWRCVCDCGKEVSAYGNQLRSGVQKSCGCYARDVQRAATGEKSSMWKGGVTHSQGYRLILMPEHPNANKNGYVREHIYVMSQHIGRTICKGETVHHKDGNRKNNEISNLELWTSNHQPGQRVSDLIESAWKIIDKYDPSHSRRFLLDT